MHRKPKALSDALECCVVEGEDEMLEGSEVLWLMVRVNSVHALQLPDP